MLLAWVALAPMPVIPLMAAVLMAVGVPRLTRGTHVEVDERIRK